MSDRLQPTSDDLALILRELHPNPADAPFIESVIHSVSPLEYELLGSAAVADIVAGRSFASPETGRRLELMDVINGLASIAGLTQCAIAVVAWMRRRRAAKGLAQAPLINEQARTMFAQHIHTSPKLASVVAERPEIVNEILELVERSLKDANTQA